MLVVPSEQHLRNFHGLPPVILNKAPPTFETGYHVSQASMELADVALNFGPLVFTSK